MQPPSWVGDSLERARERLVADVVYYVEIVDGSAVVRLVAGDGLRFGLYQGLRFQHDATYAQLVADNRALTVIADTADDDVAGSDVSGSRPAPGAFVGAPVRLATGDVFGVLCAAFADARPELTRREADVMAFVGGLVAVELGRLRGMRELREELRTRIQATIADDALRSVYQPIVDLRGGRTVGVEALTRFDIDPPRSPAMWFAEAHRVDLGTELEIAAIRTAARAVDDLPDDVYVSINASPSTLTSPEFAVALEDLDPARLVVEVTEHAAVSSYQQVVESLADLRAAGGRLAIDDLGSGFAGLSHLTGLRPDIIKIDRSVVIQAGSDAGHHSLLVGMVAFAAEADASIVAEGAETPAHLDVLAACGIHTAQGYVFARPGPAGSVRTTYEPSTTTDMAGPASGPQSGASRQTDMNA